MLRLEEAPATLAPDERRAVEEHLALCRSCRDELATLRSFDFDGLRRAGLASQSGRRWKPARIGVSLRKLVLHPAFAYGLLFLALVPTAANYLGVEFGGLKSERAPRQESPELALAPKRAVIGEGKEAAHNDALPPQRGTMAPHPPGKVRGVEKEGAFALSTQPPGEAASGSMAKQRFRGTRYGSPSGVRPSRQEPRDATLFPPGQQGRWTVAGTGGGVADSPEREETAMASRAPARAAVLGWTTMALRPGSVSKTTIPRTGLILRVPLPRQVAQLTDLKVRVRSPDHSREVRERVSAAPGARFAELRLPAPWLGPGRYDVKLWSARPGARDKRLGSFAFELH